MKALVLCAGFGRRLGDLCRERPKPLLEVGDRTIVEHILARLRFYGVKEVWINLHFRAEMFKTVLGNGDALGLDIHYVYEPEPLGTAGTVRALQEHLGSEPLIVHYGDILTDHDLGALTDAHARSGAWATAVVHQRPGSNSFAFFADGDRIDTFIERPAVPPVDPRDPWVFSGICVMSPEGMASMPAPESSAAALDLPAHVFPALAQQGRLFGHRLSGFRCAVDSPARLARAREAFDSQTFVPIVRRPQS